MSNVVPNFLTAICGSLTCETDQYVLLPMGFPVCKPWLGGRTRRPQ